MKHPRVYDFRMYFDRHIDAELLSWGRGAAKPLILRGARQTGKSSAIRRLGDDFDLFIELNLERFEDLELVRGCRSAGELLAALGVRHNLARFPDRTLLFLDEIQEHPEAVAWLRFFYEDHPQVHVAAAGSLMEVRLQERGFSFPVGRVTFRLLHPMTFFEFLEACERDVLAQKLTDAFLSGEQIPRPLHLQALDLLREYLLVGGMPKAVSSWAQGRNAVEVRRVHADLLDAFSEDFQKYRGPRDLDHLEAAFANLRHHYGQRFRYENFAPGFRSALMKSALGKLEGARLIQRVWPTSSLQPPLQIRARSAPKLLPLDVGLALTSLGLAPDTLRDTPLESLLAGRVAEMLTGQMLLATPRRIPNELLFWVSESSRSNAEVDFLLDVSTTAVPIEVKGGTSGSMKSLHQFLWRSGSPLGVRLWSGELDDSPQRVKMPDGHLDYRLVSVPLYLAEHVGAWLSETQT